MAETQDRMKDKIEDVKDRAKESAEQMSNRAPSGSANHAALRSRCRSVSPSWKMPVLMAR